MKENLFDESRNSISDTAWALVVYSMVPYLGILFVPFGIAAGAYSYWSATDDGRLGFYSIALGIVVFAVQIFLWWLLYFIPTIGQI